MKLISMIKDGRRVKAGPQQVEDLKAKGFRLLTEDEAAAEEEGSKPKAFAILGIPQLDFGKPGDFCINTSNGTLFGPKSATGWGQPLGIEHIEVRALEKRPAEIPENSWAPREGERVTWIENEKPVQGLFNGLKDQDTAIVLKDGTKNPRNVALADLAPEGEPEDGEPEKPEEE